MMRTLAAAVSIAIALAPQEAPPKRPMNDRLRAALDWLARHQNGDGSWSTQNYVRRCPDLKCEPNPGHEDLNVGVTGLAVLAMTASGVGLQDADDLGKSLRRGIDAIAVAQGQDGSFSPGTSKIMYSHAVATYAMAEALRPVPSASEEALRKSLAKATEFLLAARNQGAAWRYTPGSNENDSSVTAWALMALFSARRAGQTIPDAPINDALKWLDSVTDEKTQRVGYTEKNTGKVFVPGVNENFNHHETLAAAAGLCRALAQKKPHPAALKLVAGDLPSRKAADVDVYYWYYGTRFVREVADYATWEQWRGAALRVLADRQSMLADRCDRGSWPPDDRWSSEGGRVYVTAMSAVVLAIAQEPSPKWLFHLKDGAITFKVVSYEEKSGNYILQLTDGATKTVKKTDVHRIQKVK